MFFASKNKTLQSQHVRNHCQKQQKDFTLLTEGRCPKDMAGGSVVERFVRPSVYLLVTQHLVYANFGYLGCMPSSAINFLVIKVNETALFHAITMQSIIIPTLS